MTTAVAEKPRFTLNVGGHIVELPEADTRDEAIRKVGLTPRHWTEAPAKQRQVNNHKPKPANKSIHTPPTAKKRPSRVKTTKENKKVTKPVTLKHKTVTLTTRRNAKNNNNGNTNSQLCLFCGKTVESVRSTKHYCDEKCRVAAFRERKGK